MEASMTISQITLELDNRPGKLSGISELLGSESLNIRAIDVSDHGDKSIMRFVVENPERASNALATNGFNCSVDQVLAIEVPDHPGGLSAVLKPLKEEGINVDFMYPAIGRHGNNAILIIGTKQSEKAAEVLGANYIQLLGDEVYHL